MCLLPFVYVCINGCSFDVKLCFAGSSVGGGLTCASLLPLVRHTRTLMRGVRRVHPVLLACSSRWGYVARSDNADCLYFVSTNIGLHRTKLPICRNGQDNCVQSRHDAGFLSVLVNAAHSRKCCAKLLAANTFSSPSQCSATGYTRGHCCCAVLTFVPVSY